MKMQSKNENAQLLIETCSLYKTQKCPDGNNCLVNTCWNYHNEFEKRRFYPYPIGHSQECKNFEQGKCFDDKCNKVHYLHPNGTNEALYHPINYKGKDRFCKRETTTGCKWLENGVVHLCPFLHINEEIPEEILNWEIWEKLILTCIENKKKELEKLKKKKKKKGINLDKDIKNEFNFQGFHEDIEKILEEKIHKESETCYQCNLKKMDRYCIECLNYLCEDCFKNNHNSLSLIHHKFIPITCNCCLSKNTSVYCQECLSYDFGYLCLDCHLVIHSAKKKNHSFIILKESIIKK